MSSFEVIQNGNTFSVVQRFVSGRKDELIFDGMTHDEALEFASDCTATLPTIEHQIEWLNNCLDCKLRRLTNQADLIDYDHKDRSDILNMIDNASINAWDTLKDNRAQLEAELKFHQCDTVEEYWDSMFLGSLGSILAWEDPSEYALIWFEGNGIKRG